jgi:hypothetical protein
MPGHDEWEGGRGPGAALSAAAVAQVAVTALIAAISLALPTSPISLV